jgi:hypothetical protein
MPLRNAFYCTPARISILSIVAVPITAITVASINGFSQDSKTKEVQNSKKIMKPALDTSSQNNFQDHQTKSSKESLNNDLREKKTTNNIHKNWEYNKPDTQSIQVNKNNDVNNGSIGSSNITVNCLGIQPRKINATMIDQFFIDFLNKFVHIRFMVFNSADAEMYALKMQIFSLLRAKGYKDIGEIFNIKSAWNHHYIFNTG